MQLVQELKFSYDTALDPEIDKAVEDLVFLIHQKGSMIKDSVTPNRGGSTIAFRPADTPKEFVQDLEQFVLQSKQGV